MQVRISLKDNMLKITPSGNSLLNVSRFRNYVKFIFAGELGQLQHLVRMDTEDLIDRDRLAQITALFEELLEEVDHRYKVIKDTSEERND